MADRLGVRLLGPFRLDGVEVDALRSRQSRTVLKRLAVAQGAMVSAESLVEAVWRDDERPSLPERDLHVLVSRARRLVGADRLVRGDGGYALLADWWDVLELESLSREAVRRADAGDHSGARTAAESALALVRGTLLSDEPDAGWAAEARGVAATLEIDARRVAAAAALATGQVGRAASLATDALGNDPYDEHALRVLMRAQASAGRPASALAEFARFRALLAEDLGVDPSPETRALHEDLLRGEHRPPAFTQTHQLVGRAPQLALLDRELDRSTDGVRLVLLTGEPGSGKTSLLDAWGRLASPDTIVLRGRAEEGELALQPVLDALAGSLTRVAQLDEGTTATSNHPALPAPGATADALSLSVFGRLDDAIGSLAGRGPVALLLDNGDDADPVTWSWLAHLRRRREPRLLVVVAVRDLAGAGADIDAVVEVPPLGLADAEELLGRERAGSVWSRSGGNALLLTELARSGDDSDGELPRSLPAAVSARFRRVGEATSTLQVAAVLGTASDLDLLAAVVGVPPTDVLAHLDTGVRQAFLSERDGTLAFRHELVRLAIAAQAGSARRAWLHRRAVEVLRERPDSPALELARHAREAGDRTLAAQCFAEASEEALARLDLAGAERLLDEAIALDDSDAHRLRRSRVRMSRGDLEGADSDAERAMASDTTAEALELRAWAARNRHDLDGAVRLGRAAAKAATDPTIRASSLIAVAFGHRGNGDLREADTVLQEAEGAPAELGLPAWTGVLRVHQGRPREALMTLEPMLGAEARRGIQGFWVEHTLQMTAHAYGLLGRSADAFRVLDRLERELDRRGTAVRYAGVQHTYRSWLLRNLGDPTAEELARRGLDCAGSQEIRAQCHLDVADCLLRRGDVDATESWLVEAQAESGARRFHNKWRFDQRRGLIQARLDLARGDAGAALEAVAPVVSTAEAQGDERYGVLGRLVQATALARIGETLDDDRVALDLDALGEVAALEGWWLAADLAEASGLTVAARTASTLAGLVAGEAGPHEEFFRRVVAERL